MKPEIIIAIIILILLLISGIILFNSFDIGDLSLPKISQGMYREFKNPTGFVNTDEIRMEELVGQKVILIDFMTYSCINCQRTFPYLVSWYDKYKDQGLEIIGIHTPEFAFEKDIDNVRDAMERFNIEFPIVLDNNYETWRSYGNRYWPHKYLINIHGEIVYDHIGEGAYKETEKKIQELLEERAKVLGEKNPEKLGLTREEERPGHGSPETYFGSARNEYLANGRSHQNGVFEFSIPDKISRNSLYLGGTWEIAPEYALGSDGSTIIYKYLARNVYLVMAGTGELTVKQDGNLVNTVLIDDEKLYHLVADDDLSEHTLELEIKGNIEVYAFTFG